MKALRKIWGVLTFIAAFVFAGALPGTLCWWKPIHSLIGGAAVPFKVSMLFGYILLGFLSGIVVGAFHGVASPWRNRLVMILPAVLVLVLFFAGTAWLDGFGPEGRWQFRHIHIPYHLPENLMLVVGMLVGSIAGQSIKRVANNTMQSAFFGASEK